MTPGLDMNCSWWQDGRPATFKFLFARAHEEMRVGSRKGIATVLCPFTAEKMPTRCLTCCCGSKCRYIVSCARNTTLYYSHEDVCESMQPCWVCNEKLHSSCVVPLSKLEDDTVLKEAGPLVYGRTSSSFPRRIASASGTIFTGCLQSAYGMDNDLFNEFMERIMIWRCKELEPPVESTASPYLVRPLVRFVLGQKLPDVHSFIERSLSKQTAKLRKCLELGTNLPADRFTACARRILNEPRMQLPSAKMLSSQELWNMVAFIFSMYNTKNNSWGGLSATMAAITGEATTVDKHVQEVAVRMTLHWNWESEENADHLEMPGAKETVSISKENRENSGSEADKSGHSSDSNEKKSLSPQHGHSSDSNEKSLSPQHADAERHSSEATNKAESSDGGDEESNKDEHTVVRSPQVPLQNSEENPKVQP